MANIKQIKAKELQPGDQVRMAYGDREIYTVQEAYKASPGRGIKGVGWHVFWTDGSGTLYPANEIVDVVSQ